MSRLLKRRGTRDASPDGEAAPTRLGRSYARYRMIAALRMSIAKLAA
ncbi:hypothetical protein G7B40_004780 [Aetokthonos hydrillicola Thurmond2011]|uniref:Uncharacterized protein n=1 Tax=Aetokthonos hydrillicola Thurmond2011 TaxID=2712845 RepID=A0AAP5I501_9CYAN|nr:hypothetical protein [Aetokthonos hydrillicola]MBO3458323.1 hypothetical protein [Aetokthonos hydrillicola CCALA 1050]MBW4585886.1 hypothetical protein [Aetokthonos hydrillicola CCALA 1050]MDR9893889.1 hypothetical protein [Aetokthonos hydrillicola Thurmond2011]